MNKIFLIVKKKKVYIPLIIVLLVVGVFVFLNNNTNKNYETGLVVRSDFNEEVSVTGKVVAAEAVDLAFESSGKIVSIPAQVGVLVKKDQVLASLNGGDAYANLLNAQARLTSEQVQLEEMKKGARPEELKIAQDSYDQAKLTLEESINDAYIQADDAIRGKTDMLFTDAENSYPVFITIQDYYFKQDIEDQRAGFTKILEDWRDKGATVTEAKAHLALINSYLNDLTTAMNMLSDTEYETEATVSSYKASISSARNGVSSANALITSSEKAFLSAEGNLALKKAGATAFEIQSKEALVQSMQASVLQAQTALAKTTIRAPFDALVSKIDFKIGQFVGAGSPGISLVSAANFEIESFIPEADIAQVSLNDKARVTLDAYGDNVVFDAVVTQIDFSDTQVEGVSTYKTILQFEKNDERIKSGMTANIDIQNETRTGVLNIPQSAIINTEGKKTVLLIDEKGKTKSQIIKTASLDGKGNIEIVEGLTEQQKIVTNPPKK